MASTLSRTPTARTFSISDLLLEVEQGRVRVPKFQRLYRWNTDDVINLLDSVYRGYPIGSLLLWKREAPYEVVALGTLRIEAPATSDALWVVDGQQRITSLAGVLLSVGEPEDARFSIFFDLNQRRFVRGQTQTAPHLLPMNRVADTRALLRWLGELQRAGGTDSLVTAAEDLSKRVREYQVPAYIVETGDENTLRTIFDRLNTFGRSLKSAEVFQALHGARSGRVPEDLRTLGSEVVELGFGELDQNSLLRVVLGLRGPDIYRDFRSEFADGEDPAETFRSAALALERVIAYLRTEAGIPHLRLLPYRFAIPVLARFFHLHPEPDPRSRMLLRRWLWRDALGRQGGSTSVSAAREAVRAIDGDEDGSVQRLLALAPHRPRRDDENLSARLNEARARANVALMGMWRPRSLVDGRSLDLARHFQDASVPLPTIVTDSRWKSSLADRMLHEPTASPLDALILDSPLFQTDPVTFAEALESHGIDEAAVDVLGQGDVEGFLERRRDRLIERLRQTGDSRAEWGYTDRPPLSRLLVPEEDDDG